MSPARMDRIRKPDVEFRRKVYGPSRVGDYRVHKGYRIYGHIYWRPLIVVALGRVLWGRRHLRAAWKADR